MDSVHWLAMTDGLIHIVNTNTFATDYRIHSGESSSARRPSSMRRSHLLSAPLTPLDKRRRAPTTLSLHLSAPLTHLDMCRDGYGASVVLRAGEQVSR